MTIKSDNNTSNVIKNKIQAFLLKPMNTFIFMFLLSNLKANTVHTIRQRIQISFLDIFN